MQPRVVDRIKTRLAQHLLDLNLTSVAHQHASSDRAAIRFCAHQLELEPVVRAAEVIAQQRRRLVEIDYQDVQISIIVEVTEGAPPAAMLGGYARAGFLHKFFEGSIP